jgi:hypothetical protein
VFKIPLILLPASALVFPILIKLTPVRSYLILNVTPGGTPVLVFIEPVATLYAVSEVLLVPILSMDPCNPVKPNALAPATIDNSQL